MFQYLIDQVEQFSFCWVHSHRPHSIAKLPCVDRPPAVHVKLVESLLQLGDLLLAEGVCHVWWGDGGGLEARERRGLVAAERERS